MAGKATGEDRMATLALAATNGGALEDQNGTALAGSLREAHSRDTGQTPVNTKKGKTGGSSFSGPEAGDLQQPDFQTAWEAHQGDASMGDADLEHAPGGAPPGGAPPEAFGPLRAADTDLLTRQAVQAANETWPVTFKQHGKQHIPTTAFAELEGPIIAAIQQQLPGTNVGGLAVHFSGHGRAEGYLTITFDNKQASYDAVILTGRLFVGTFKQPGALKSIPLYLTATPGNSRDLFSARTQVIMVKEDPEGIAKEFRYNAVNNAGGMTTGALIDIMRSCKGFNSIFGQSLVCYCPADRSGVVKAWYEITDPDVLEEMEAAEGCHHSVLDQTISDYVMQISVDAWPVDEKTTNGWSRYLVIDHDRFRAQDKCTFKKDSGGTCGRRHLKSSCPTREAYIARCEEAGTEPAPAKLANGRER